MTRKNPTAGENCKYRSKRAKGRSRRAKILFSEGVLFRSLPKDHHQTASSKFSDFRKLINLDKEKITIKKAKITIILKIIGNVAKTALQELKFIFSI